MTWYTHFKTHGDKKSNVILEVTLGENCYDVTYSASDMDGESLPEIGGLQTLNAVLPRISPDDAEVFQPLDFNSLIKIMPEGAEKCPYHEILVDANNQDWQSYLGDSIPKSSDTTVMSNPFISDFNNDPRFD